MLSEGFKRKLTAILNADVEGYSRLIRENEETTIRTLTAYRGVMATLIQKYRGRVVDSPGDNLLAEFASVVDAVECAVEIQRELAERNAELPAENKMAFRIGVNLGDVVVEEDGRIYGDGVNIAARLESICESGGVCISGTTFEHIQHKLDLEFEDLGEHEVKNITNPVRVYRVLSHPGAAAHRVVKAKRRIQRKWRNAALALASLLVIGAGILTIWNFFLRPAPPTVEPASTERMTFPLPDKPSIAVLPFANMSDDPAQEYFADGMTEDLITDLSQMSGLFVIARNSTFVYKGKPFKIRQVAEELGVRYVLEGSVRKAGEKVRINTQLIDASTGHHLWAKRYDGQLIDVFALQDKITQNIVSALKVKLSIGEKEQVDRKETDNIKAYDAYLQGWKYYRRNTPEDWAKAISHFEKAIELDPEYSRAYAALALIYWRHTRTSRVFAKDSELGVDYYEARARASENLQIARRKPTSIYYRVGASMALYRRQYARAIAEAEHAIDLDPNEVDGFYTLAYILMAAGNPDRAVEFIKKGMRFDPHNVARPLYLLGMAHFSSGQLKEAASLIERALTHNPNLPRLAPFLPSALAHLGQEQKAQVELENFKKSVIHYSYRTITFNFPFQDPEVLDRLVDGIRKAGMWAPDFKFYKFFPEDMLDEEEIRELIFGRKVAAVGFSRVSDLPYWIKRTVDGKATWSVPPNTVGDYDDSGRSWIEDSMLCNKWKIHLAGVKNCMSIFRNPEGTPEMKNEYIGVSDFDFHPFSPVN
jgi:TolB-like protein/class 3 adenylate cyclase/Flp pilus assembly protein TadD